MDDAAFEARLLDEWLLCAIGNGPPKNRNRHPVVYGEIQKI